ncbi:uncharacterized protein [Periplaneta americana]|uniref:uncharacterized protein isoform X9 n=1 Tax=Periplaneta americana TaxID=6978 RepID=UPI0037E84131
MIDTDGELMRGRQWTSGFLRNIMMDVIKMESEVNSVAVGIGDDTETEEKLLPEVDNMLDHDTDERKVELVDPGCGLASSLCFEEMPVPITFPVVKSEPEEYSWDMDEKNLDVATEDNAILPDNYDGCDQDGIRGQLSGCRNR